MSIFHFAPSTKQLFKALKFDWGDPANEEQARDIYPIDAALSDWKNRLYDHLSEEEYERGTWPASSELLDAMRAALADQRGNYAGDLLAYCLVRCGCRQAETIAGLSAWDAQLFRWRASGLSARDLLEKFEKIGVAGNPAAEDLDKLDSWLSDPVAALAHYGSGNITGTVLKGRVFLASLYSSGDDLEYAALFQEMARHAEPALQISKVSQVAADRSLEDFTASAEAQLADIVPDTLKGGFLFTDPETFWKISYDFEGVSEAVFVPGSFAWMNDVGLALHFDAMLARLGRPERVLKFGGGRNESDSFWGRYIIAPPQQFYAVCNELGIPLDPFTGIGRP
jgi:hypothetical protein